MWRLAVTLFFVPLLTLFGGVNAAQAQPLIRIGVLKYGTVNWELSAMQQLGLDTQHGFKLDILPLANLPATRIALKSGRVDIIVADWLWVARQREQGDALQMFPYSRTVGQLLVPQESPIQSLADLRGKRIGVAGGPLSKGWILLQAAARQQGFNLATQSTPVFAAPPLLNASLEQRRIDALVTFWHYGARLQSRGFRLLTDLQSITAQLGMTSRLPMLGYVFSQAWAEQHPRLIEGYYQAVAATKQQLADQPDSWQPIRPLMKVASEREFEYLRQAYLAGIPSALTALQVSDAQLFYRLLQRLELARGWPDELDTGSFWQRSR